MRSWKSGQGDWPGDFEGHGAVGRATSAVLSDPSTHQLSEVDTLKLIHELQVHQIELEMQNEKLRLAKEQTNIAAEKFTELYDLAPSGFFTLSATGEIVELNHCGSQMLGKESIHLLNSRFGFFVSDDTRPVFNHFLDKVISSKTKES